jgi:hypothetical protein
MFIVLKRTESTWHFTVLPTGDFLCQKKKPGDFWQANTIFGDNKAKGRQQKRYIPSQLQTNHENWYCMVGCE